MAFKAKQRAASADIHYLALGVGSIVEIWPPTYPREVLIGEAWQSTGEALRDAIKEFEGEQKEAPEEEVHSGRETRRSTSSQSS